MKSHDVEDIEAPTLGELFDKIAADPSTKNGEGPYICAPMKWGIRSATNAKPTRVMMLDFDSLSTSQAVQLRKAVEDLKISAVMWTTRRHTSAKPRIRVLVALSDVVAADQYPLVHAGIVSALKCKSGCEFEVDPTSERPHQPEFVPLATSDVTKLTGAGRLPFDVSTALAADNVALIVSGASSKHDTQDKGDLPNDPIVAAAKKKALKPLLIKPGTVGLRCPWKQEHTGESSPSSSALLLPHYEGREGYGYKCLHAHCAHRTIKDLRDFLGLADAGSQELDLQLQPISADWLDVALPPKEFVLDGWLPRGTVGLLVAEGGTGKTMLALRIAMAVAGGRDLFGITTRHGKAVLLGLEDPEDVLRRRVKSIYDAEAVEYDETMTTGLVNGPSYKIYTNNLRERLFCKSLVGSEMHLVQTGSGGAQQSEQIDRLISMLKDIGNIELLVLDPLSRLHGLEENDSSVGTALINAAERIAQEVGCAVLMTHHTGKQNSKDRTTNPYSARGSSALADGARVVMRLITAERDSDLKYSNVTAEEIESGSILILVHAKSNYSKLQPKLWLRKDEAVLSHFAPVPKDAFYSLWKKFIEWWSKKMSPNPVFKSGLAERRVEIWGQGTTKDQVAAFVQQSLDEDLLKPVGTGGAKNPHSQALMPVTNP